MARNHCLFSSVLVLVACSHEQKPLPDATAAKNTAAQEYAAFEVSWPRPSSPEVAARAKSVVEVMLNQQLQDQPFAQQLESASRGSVSLLATLGSSSTIAGRYRHGPDELLLNRRELQQDASSASDVGEGVARARAVEALQRLAAASVVDPSLYDFNTAIASRTLLGTGSSDADDQVERVLSYDFLVQQSLNGIPFVNSGLRVSVHRSGAIAAIRVGGARVSATFEAGRLRPIAPGYVFRATVDESYFDGRFVKEYPNAHINNEGVMYMLPMTVDPEAGQKQVLEPAYVFGFSNHYGDLVARRRYVAYSLSNPSAPAQDWSPRATPGATGDPRPGAVPAPGGASGPLGQ